MNPRLEGRVHPPLGDNVPGIIVQQIRQAAGFPLTTFAFILKRALTLVTQKSNATPDPPPSVFLGGS